MWFLKNAPQRGSDAENWIQLNFTHPEFQTKLTTMSCTLVSEPFSSLLFFLQFVQYENSNTCGADVETEHTHTDTTLGRWYLFNKSKFYYFDRAHVIFFFFRFSSIHETLNTEHLSEKERREKNQFNLFVFIFESRNKIQQWAQANEKNRRLFGLKSFGFFLFLFKSQRKDKLQ